MFEGKGSNKGYPNVYGKEKEMVRKGLDDIETLLDSYIVENQNRLEGFEKRKKQ